MASSLRARPKASGPCEMKGTLHGVLFRASVRQLLFGAIWSGIEGSSPLFPFREIKIKPLRSATLRADGLHLVLIPTFALQSPPYGRTRNFRKPVDYPSSRTICLLTESTSVRGKQMRTFDLAVSIVFLCLMFTPHCIATAQPLVYDVTVDYAAVGDGVNDDTSEINKAINDASAAGGGTVYMPPGTYLINNGVIALKHNVTLKGAGRTATTIKSGSTIQHAVVDSVNQSQIGVSDFTIDGGASIGGGCLRAGGVDEAPTLVTDVTWKRVKLVDCFGYGFALQKGSFQRVLIDDVQVEDAGSDASDIKNLLDLNRDIVIRNIDIKNVAAGKAGLDIRGPADLSEIDVEMTTASSIGIRFRTTGPNGIGAEKGRNRLPANGS